MPNPRSVIIVGGGIVGLSVAYYALQRGFQVTVLERGGPEDEGCSYGNAGMIVPSHFVPLAAPGMVGLGLRMLRDPSGPFAIRLRLSRELLEWCWRFYRACSPNHVRRAAPVLCGLQLASRQCYDDLAERLGNSFGLEKRGLLMVCKTERVLEEEAQLIEQAREYGLDASLLDSGGLARLDSGIHYNVAGAVYYPADCHLVPYKLMRSLRETVEREGGVILWNTEVTGWENARGRLAVVCSNQEKLAAQEFVVAAGSWTPAVLRGLGIRLPMQAGKGYNLTLPNPRVRPTLGAILVEARVAVTPMDGALRFAGTMELGGLDLSVNRKRVQGIIHSIPQYYPEFRPQDFEGVPVWAGLRPCSPDGLPYIGRIPAYENLTIATGHAMMGLSLGPITGKLVSEMLSGDPPSIDLNLLRPDRFA